MSQQLQQQEHAKKVQLSFEEICPIWSLQLSGIKQSDIDINDYNLCIVGEAHANNGTHYILQK